MKAPKKSKTSTMNGLNPQKERREIGQKNPKPNLGMIQKAPTRPMPRGR